MAIPDITCSSSYKTGVNLILRQYWRRFWLRRHQEKKTCGTHTGISFIPISLSPFVGCDYERDEEEEVNEKHRHGRVQREDGHNGKDGEKCHEEKRQERGWAEWGGEQRRPGERAIVGGRGEERREQGHNDTGSACPSASLGLAAALVAMAMWCPMHHHERREA